MRGPEERSLRKSIDTYTVLGLWLVTADELTDPSQLSLKLSINGELRQTHAICLLTYLASLHLPPDFTVLYLVMFFSTGTPEGVGPIAPGDVIQSEISQIGAMTASVQAYS